MKIATWNVNSIRARLHIVPDWLVKNDIDILMMQEIKCENHQFPYEVFEDIGYNCVDLVNGQKALNGVAILSKIPPHSIKKDLPLFDFQDIYNEARYIETKVEFNGNVYRICNGYFPNGSPLSNYEGVEVESPRFFYKLDFFDRYTKYIENEMNNNPDEIFILGGDFNVMHKDIDVYNPKNWVGKIAFLPEEKDRLDDIINLDFADVFRKFNPETKEYTWWDYRSGGFPKNYGLRIDYIFIQNKSLNLIKNCTIDRETRAMEKPSDHAPCVVEIG